MIGKLAFAVAAALTVTLGPLSPGGAGATVRAAELIMLEQPGCRWCARWNEEIAPAYPKTEEGSMAPLRRVDITKAWPDDLREISEDIYTPTFILVENGQEIARLRGYPGDHFFWPMLGEMLAKLP